MTKFELLVAMNKIMDQLQEVICDQDTNADKVVKEYWKAVNSFPVPLREVV